MAKKIFSKNESKKYKIESRQFIDKCFFRSKEHYYACFWPKIAISYYREILLKKDIFYNFSIWILDINFLQTFQTKIFLLEILKFFNIKITVFWWFLKIHNNCSNFTDEIFGIIWCSKVFLHIISQLWV